tara:strand:- start:197 stop:325 length:129 start_codon:yes stop_codon:yes gene_type:complete
MYAWLVFLAFAGFLVGLHSLFFGEKKNHGNDEERQKGFFDVI